MIYEMYRQLRERESERARERERLGILLLVNQYSSIRVRETNRPTDRQQRDRQTDS